MSINTRRTYTADDIAELTILAVDAQSLDAEVRAVMAELDALLTARDANFYGWQAYTDQFGLEPLIEAIDTDKHFFATANTSYIPQVGHYWNSRWNPATWRQRNKRTRRDIDGLRKAIKACEEYAVAIQKHTVNGNIRITCD